ncbi:MAG: hypothetical protein Q8S84_03500 [bacterium]|nr:hypothetical protein [bacterium]
MNKPPLNSPEVQKNNRSLVHRIHLRINSLPLSGERGYKCSFKKRLFFYCFTQYNNATLRGRGVL